MATPRYAQIMAVGSGGTVWTGGDFALIIGCGFTKGNTAPNEVVIEVIDTASGLVIDTVVFQQSTAVGNTVV